MHTASLLPILLLNLVFWEIAFSTEDLGPHRLREGGSYASVFRFKSGDFLIIESNYEFSEDDNMYYSIYSDLYHLKVDSAFLLEEYEAWKYTVPEGVATPSGGLFIGTWVGWYEENEFMLFDSDGTLVR